MGNHRLFGASSEADLVDHLVDIYWPDPYSEPSRSPETETNETLLAEVEGLETENRLLNAKVASLANQVVTARVVLDEVDVIAAAFPEVKVRLAGIVGKFAAQRGGAA